MLSPMRYKDFTWPHNPQVYSVSYERPAAVLKVPLGGWYVQDLGPAARVMRGEGVFYGSDAYETFLALEELFQAGGKGLLVHPVWRSANAYFTELTLRQEPLPDYVVYSFAFREGSGDGGADLTPAAFGAASSEAAYRTVAQGETFWSVAADCGLSFEALIALNPQLRSLNDVKTGDRVRVS